MKKQIVFSLTILSLFLGVNCNQEPPIVPPVNPLVLTVEDVTCTEAFLKISLAAVETDRTIILMRGDSTISELRLLTFDTIFVDEGLFPQKTYTYSVVARNWSASAQTTTMDTTSHNWSFTLDIFGERSSYLADVAIINDSLAYAVGEIHTKDTYTYDSLGNWINPYNIAKWDGKNWELIRAYYNYNGQNIWSTIYSVFAFNSNEIWFEAGIRWNGKVFETKPLNIDFPSHVYKMWGSLSGELYAVGENGLIARRNSDGFWQKLESGTTQYLVDISGNNSDLYSVGINLSRDGGVVLKKINGKWEKIIEGVTEGTGFLPAQLFKTQLYGSTDGLWVDEKGTIYTVGNYMYRNKLGKWNYEKSLPENYLGGKIGYRGYLHAVNGNAPNDLFIAGQRGTLRHFNGYTWEQVGLPFDYNDLLHYWYSISVKNNIAIAVGSMDRKARVIVLRRK